MSAADAGSGGGDDKVLHLLLALSSRLTLVEVGLASLVRQSGLAEMLAEDLSRLCEQAAAAGSELSDTRLVSMLRASSNGNDSRGRT